MSEPRQFRLLGQRRFAPFFWTQFLGAMNDNVFKVAFTSLVTYHTALFSGIDAATAAFLAGGTADSPVRRTEWTETPNLRRVLVDMVDEYARHTGHADLIRESIDGLVGEGLPPEGEG